MSQSAEEISRAIEAWIDGADEGLKLPLDWTTNYLSEIHSLGDLIYYMEDEAPKLDDGNRWISIPGVDGLIRVKLRTGGEGQGEETYVIFELKAALQDVRYFRIDGYYVSHDGFHYEDGDLTEVGPVEKPVVFWEPVA